MASSKPGGKLLYRVIASHLVVAVPPAVALGFLVNDINRAALKLEAQKVHISLASRMSEQIARDIEARRRVLEESERILDMSEIPLDRRQVLLRALVANGDVAHLAIFGPDGGFDTVIRGKGTEELDRRPIPEALLEELNERGWAVADADLARREARVIVAWLKDGEPFGYLGTVLELGPIAARAAELSAKHLDLEGEVDVIDGARRYLASSKADRVGQSAGEGTPFSGFEGASAREGAAAIELGTSSSFVDATGERRLGAVVSDPALRWIVGVSRPERVAFESLERVRVRVILLSIVAAFAAGFLGLLLARHVSEPIRKLSAAVRRSVKGGFGDPVAAKGTREVAELSEAFNDAVKELARYRTELRAKAQLSLRLSRFLPPTALHEVLSREMDVQAAGQQQQVTMVYADVWASGELQQRFAAEHLVSVLGEFFAAACASVERHGGRVDRYSGDAVIGIFSPDFHQEYTHAAMRAALDILKDSLAISARWQESVGAGFTASVGVVTGVATLGVAPGGEISAVGEMVELAATLQGSAGGGMIAADRATRDALGRELGWRRPATATGTRELFVLDPARPTKELDT